MQSRSGLGAIATGSEPKALEKLVFVEQKLYAIMIWIRSHCHRLRAKSIGKASICGAKAIRNQDPD